MGHNSYCRRLAMRVLLLFLCLGSIQCLPQKPSSLNLNMNNVKIKTQKPGGGGIIHPAFGEATHEMPEVPDVEQLNIGTFSGNPPIINGNQPTINGNRPTINGNQPTINGNQPTINGNQPTSNGNQPSTFIDQS